MHLVAVIRDMEELSDARVSSVHAGGYQDGMNRLAVLLVDDDDATRTLAKAVLERAGYRVVEATDGRRGLLALYAERPSLVVLDVLMPDVDGWSTLERIRELTDVPVLMLSSQSAEQQKVRALQAGADDYVTKPFGHQELLARVESLLRRSRSVVPELRSRYDDGVLAIEHDQRAVKVGGNPVDLSPLEYRLLTTLVEHRNRVLSHEQLMVHVWGAPGRVGPAQVKLTVSRLRRKLSAGGGRAPVIEARRGFGYMLRVPVGGAGQSDARPNR